MANWWDDLEPQAAASGKNWWDDLVPEQRKPFGYREETPESANWDGPVMVPASTRRSFGEFMSDLKPAIGAGVGSAAAGLAQLPADTWNAAVQYSPLRMAIEKASPQAGARIQSALSVEQPGVVRAATDLLQGATDDQREQYSSGHQAFQEQLEHTEGFMPTARMLLTSPGHLATMGTEVGAQMAPGGVGARGLGMLSKGLRGARAQTGANAAMQSGMAGSLAQDEVQAVLEATPVSDLRQYEDFNRLKYMLETDDDEVVKDWLIRNNSTSAFAQSFGVNLATSLLIPGGATIESAMLGNASRVGTSRLRNAALGAAGEATSEGLAEAGEAVSQNVATYQPWDEGVGQAGALGSILGAGMGAGAGFAQRPSPLRDGDDLLSGGNSLDATGEAIAQQRQSGADRIGAMTGNLTDTLRAQQLAQLEAGIDAAQAPEEMEAAEAQLREFQRAIRQGGPGDVDAMLSGLFDVEADPAGMESGADSAAARGPIPMPRGPETQEQMFADIHLSARDAELSRQRDAELDLIARESRLPVALLNAENEAAIADASGALDVAAEPTAMQLAMQLAMQAAMRRRQQGAQVQAAEAPEGAGGSQPTPEPAPNGSEPDNSRIQPNNSPIQIRFEPKGEKGLLVHGDHAAIRERLAAAGFRKNVRNQDGALLFDAKDRPALEAALAADAVAAPVEQKRQWRPRIGPNGKPVTDSRGRPMTDPVLDYSRDNLLHWLAASGGVNFDEVRAQGGADPALMKDPAVTRPFGRIAMPAMRRNGGLTLDQVRERMQAEGWLPADDPNNPSAVSDNDALDLIMDAINGHTVFHPYEGADARMADAARERSEHEQLPGYFADGLLDEPTNEGAALDWEDDLAAYAEALGREPVDTDVGEAYTVAELARTAYDLGADPMDVAEATGAFGDMTAAQQAAALWNIIKERNNGTDRSRGAETDSGGDAQALGGPATAVPSPGNRPGEDGGNLGQGESGTRGGFQLAGQQASQPEQVTQPASQGGLFAPPTRGEVMDAEIARRDAERNGQEGTGRTDMMAGDGELFAGPRPAQAAIESTALPSSESGASDTGSPTTASKSPSAMHNGWATRNAQLGEAYAAAKKELDDAERPLREARNADSRRLPPGYKTIPHPDREMPEGVALQDDDGNDIAYPLTPSEAVDRAWRDSGRTDRFAEADSREARAAPQIEALRAKVKAAQEAWDANGKSPMEPVWERERQEKAESERKTRDAAAKGARTRAKKKEAKQVVQPTAATASSEKGEKIEDFGEKLEGARKHLPPSLKEELSDEQIASQPLSKVWPANAHESIEDDTAAALAFAARAEISAKPRKAYKLRRWVEQVKTLRDVVRNPGDARSFIREGEAIQGVRGLDEFFAKARLLAQLPRETWERVERVGEYPAAHRYDERGKKVETPFSSVTIDGKTHSFDGGRIGPEEVAQVKALLAGQDAPKKTGLTAKDFEIRTYRGRPESFINRKGDSEQRPLKTFTGKDSAKQARAWLNDNVAQAEAEWEKVKARDNVSKADTRRSENRERVGENRRDGKDVTEQMFTDAFGFRGVQFGNLVGQGKGAKDRQGLLNEAYDALLDLADILGIPSKAISLNGTLGLSLGARGSGKHAAHFERDNLVINLTKTRGAGSLAHEWFHGLDNYFSRLRGTSASAPREGDYITYKPEAVFVQRNGRGTGMTAAQLRDFLKRTKQWDEGKTLEENAAAAAGGGYQRDPNHQTGVRPQVERAFAELVEALNASPMAARSRKLDKSLDGYWHRIIERGARSFENYVISKMTQRGWTNDFLANVRSWGEWSELGKNKERYPYLLPEEEAPVVEAFDKLFATIESRTDPETGNVPLFSRSRAARRSASFNESAYRPAVVLWARARFGDAVAKNGRPAWQNFVEWFGDSQAVDGAGRPIEVYHGSPDGRFVDADGVFMSLKDRYGAQQGVGAFWFAKDRATARSYADDRRAFDYQNAEARVIPAFISLKNPLIVDGKGKEWREAQAIGKTTDVIEKAQAEGHDGVIIRNVKDDYNNSAGTKPTDTFVVFNSRQIKSAADNSGDFDDLNPDIRLARGQSPARRGTPLGEEKNRAIEAIAVRVAGVNSVGRRLVNVVDGAAGLPAEVRQHMADEGVPAEEVRGVHWKGRTWLVAENLHSVQDVEETLFHEHYTHFGLRAKYGAKLGGELGRLLDGIGGIDGVRKIAADQGIELSHYEATLRASRSIPNAHKRLILMEELLAHMGEATGTLRRTLEEWLGIVRNWLRSRGFADLADYNAADLAFVLRQARQAAQEKAAAGADGQPMYSRRSGDAPENEVAYRHGEEELASRLVRSGLAQEGEADGRGGIGLVPRESTEPNNYSDVRRGEGAFVLEFASREEARAEAERLIAAARREGFFWDDGAQARVLELAWDERAGGAEHDVYIVGAGDAKLAIRSTANGIYGNRADITPAMYLQRLQEYNQIFPHLQMRLIGVSEDPDGNAVLWTAQKFVEGREFDSDAELAAAMAEQGWDQDGDDPRFIHRETGAIIEDAHSGNILHADGELFPIDVHVEKLPARGTTAAVPATVESEPSAPYSPGAMFSRRAPSATATPPAGRTSTAGLGTQLVNKLHADILPRMGRPGDFISEQLDDGFERDWVDEFVDLRRAEEATARRLGVNPEDLPDHMQARRQETLRHGAYQDRLRNAERDYFEPVAKILGDADLDRDGFADYLWWRHAGERDAYLRAKHAGTPGAADLAGIDPKEAAQNIANLPAKARRAFEKAAAHIDQLRQHTLDVLVDSGQIPASTRDALLARWQHYVPLRGLPAGMDDPIIASFNGGGKGLSVARNPLGKKALGRKSKPQDILEQMHLDLERALIGAEKQKVLKAIIGLIHANPDIGKVDPVKTEKREVNGVIQHVMTSGDHTTQLTYLHQGRPVKIELANQHLTQAALNMNEPLPIAIRNLAKVTRWLSAVKTAYSPYFMLINPIRDTEFAALGVAVERGLDVFKSAAKFYPHTFGALRRDRHGAPLNKDIDRYAREFAKVGGKTGYTFVNDITELRNNLNRMFAKERKALTPGKAWRAVNDMVEAANEYAENAARLAVFAALREHGATVEQAGNYAKEVTVNFNTKGRLGKKASAFYMFFNAAVQGTRRVHGLAKNRAFQAAMAGLTGASYALALAQMVAMGDDDDDESLYLKKIKDTDRLRSLPISVGDEEWLSVPVPYGPNFFNYLGSKMAEITYEQMRGRKVDAAKVAGQVFSAASQSFSPIDAGDGLDALVPELARIIQNVRNNKDDWGRPLNYTQHYNTEENRPMFAEGSVTTGDAFKVFARVINRITGGSDYEAGGINLSPEQVRYVTQQALGGMYRLGSESYELLEKMLTDDKITAQDVPLSNVFLRSRPFERQQSEGFYENRTWVNDLRRQFKTAHERQDQTKIDGLLSEYPWLRGAQLDANSRAGKITQSRTPVGALRRTEREIGKLRVTREAAHLRVGRFEGLTVAESRAKMREIDREIAELQKQFNATVNRAK